LRILLFGKSGQVGWELHRALAPVGEVIALDRTGSAPLCGNLADGEGLSATVRHVRPDVIVNAAAYTAVDRAESEPEAARIVNAEAVGLMAREAAALGAWLVHFSTDYVFDGSGSRPWRETDPTGPLNVYGRTKLEGEQLVRAAGGRHLILRTSWVYAARGRNFARTMLRLAAERDSLTVIDDQAGAPTGAELLADATVHAILRAARDPALSGTYHVTAGGETNWYEYARFVLDVARAAGAPLRVPPQGILPVPSTAFPTAAQRPLNSRLDTRKFRQSFGLELPDWRIGVERVLCEVLEPVG
jgi:dTDP-4-dehydrorhamnose reductase